MSGLVFQSDNRIHILSNRPFPCSSGPLYQNEVNCSAFDTEVTFHSHENKAHFHKKGTRKWPIKVTRPSFFWGVPSYFEALWYPHLYFYRKSNT